MCGKWCYDCCGSWRSECENTMASFWEGCEGRESREKPVAPYHYIEKSYPQLHIWCTIKCCYARSKVVGIPLRLLSVYSICWRVSNTISTSTLHKTHTHIPGIVVQMCTVVTAWDEACTSRACHLRHKTIDNSTISCKRFPNDFAAIHTRTKTRRLADM